MITSYEQLGGAWEGFPLQYILVHRLRKMFSSMKYSILVSSSMLQLCKTISKIWQMFRFVLGTI